MWLAIDAVKKGEADVAISAGNTGALMAMAKFDLKTMAGIERPAIAGRWPTLRGETIVLDVGASIGADAQHIVDMAVMGSAMARIVFNLERPKVALLNIGVEEVKGLEEVRDAGRILREAGLPDFEYVGFIEGSDIGKGLVDVVVTEGFSGNIAIKVAEGTARQFTEVLKGHEPHRRGPARLPARARRSRRWPQDGSAQGERRRLPRSQRHRHQEPRRDRCRRLRRGGRSRLRDGPLRPARQDQPHARSVCAGTGGMQEISGAAS